MLSFCNVTISLSLLQEPTAELSCHISRSIFLMIILRGNLTLQTDITWQEKEGS